MSRSRKLVNIIGATATVAGIAVAGPGGAAGAAPAPTAVEPLPGSVAAFAVHTKATGTVARSDRLTIQVWLRPRLDAAMRFATAVSTPGSPLFRHYLSPGRYTDRFGATSREAGRVASWLQAKGFTHVRADAGRDYVRATAAVSKIDAAFQTRLKLYRESARANAGRYPLRANDRPVSVPASLAAGMLGVTGLDNVAPILPLDRPDTRPAGDRVPEATPGLTVPCSRYYGQHEISGLPEQFGTTTFPSEVCGYSARQLRAAYGASSQATGTGQTIALAELGLTQDMFLNLQDYAAANQMPAPSRSRYRQLSLAKGNGCGPGSEVEEPLDVEASYDMAPDANQLVIGGDSCDTGDFGWQGLFDVNTAVLNGVAGHPLASIVSNPWESGPDDQPILLTNIEHAFLVRAAGEGVGMYFSSGDGSGVGMPSADPFAIAVGGTTLGIGPTNKRLFETGWSSGLSSLRQRAWFFMGERWAAGGGPSLLWKEPAYQHGVVPPALARAPGNRGPARSAPDISADADPSTGFAVGLLKFSRQHRNQPPEFVKADYGGTSLATVLVAGMVTAAQQGQAKAFGFLDPTLYQLAGTRAFFDTLPLTSHSPAPYRGIACPPSACRRFTGLSTPVLFTFDDQNRHMAGYTGQVTLKGYDNMGGLGTPDGPNFINALRAVR